MTPIRRPSSDALSSGTKRDGRRFVELPKSALDRRVHIVVTVRWRGELFGLSDIDGDRAHLLYAGDDHRRAARAVSLEGDQYYGWSTTAPLAELEHVETTEKRFG